MLSRPAFVRIVCTVIFTCLVFPTGIAFAQQTVAQIAPGSSATVYDTSETGDGDGPNIWAITNSSNAIVAQSGNAGSWVVSKTQSTNGSFHVGVPSTASLGAYTYTYTNSLRYPNPDGGYLYGGGTGTFTVVSAIPAPAPGPAYSWQASVGGVNTANGNKMTVIPITGFAVPGGMSIDLALTHNSQTAYSNFNGQKWTFSYLDFVVTDPTAPHNVTMYWGDGRVYQFVNSNGKYLPPAGIYDTLTASGSTYTLKTQNQVSYQFSQPGTGTLANYQFLKTITDENGNQIAVNYSGSTNDVVTSVSDSTGRALSFTYTGGLMTKVTDPLGRAWTFGYTGADLTSVNVPPLADGIPRAYAIGYDSGSHHDIMISRRSRT